MWEVLWEATVKAVPTLGVALLTLLLGWLVGTRITSRWEEDKKRRELRLEALSRFYELYGEFYAVWKLWSIHKKSTQYLPTHERESKTTWELLERAAEVEGGFESLLVRVTQERILDPIDIQNLARFREGYQSLRESIRINATLDWKANPNKGEPAQKYREFKNLAANLAHLLSPTEPGRLRGTARPSLKDAAGNLTTATSVEYRGDWWEPPLDFTGRP